MVKKQEYTNKANGQKKMSVRLIAAYTRHTRYVNMAVVLVLFTVALFIRINALLGKTELHPDEVYSMAIATCDPNYNIPLPDGDYTGLELKNMLVKSCNSGLKGTFEDLGQLWLNNGDAPHASLYYMLLRISLTGFDSYNLMEYVLRGGLLNLIFFALSFLLMYRLLRRIFGNRHLLVFVGLSLAFFNLLSVRNTILLREYQMAETAVIALTYVAVGFVQRLRSGERFILYHYIALFSVTIAMVISLGYFNVFYVVLLGGALMMACIKYRQPKLMLIIPIAGLLAVVIALVLYLGFFNFLMFKTVHQSQAFHKLSTSLSLVFRRDLRYMLFMSYGFWIVIATFVVAVFSRHGLKSLAKSKYFVWLPFLALLCMPLILYASVLKHPRYYYSLIPILMLIVPQALSVMSSLWRRYFSILILMFFTLLTPQMHFRNKYGWNDVRNELNRPVMFYKLNPNELIQLTPNLSDSVTYKHIHKADLSNVVAIGDSVNVVTKTGKIDSDKFAFVGKPIWNNKIYIFNVHYAEEKSEE